MSLDEFSDLGESSDGISMSKCSESSDDCSSVMDIDEEANVKVCLSVGNPGPISLNLVLAKDENAISRADATGKKEGLDQTKMMVSTNTVL